MPGSSQQKLPVVFILPGLSLVAILAIIISLFGRIFWNGIPCRLFKISFFYSLQACLVLIVGSVLQLLYGLLKKAPHHHRAGSLALLLSSAPVLFSLAAVGIDALKAPMIHDISTDTSSPPEFSIISSLRTAEENPLEYEGENIAAQQRQAYPDIQPLFTAMSPEEATRRAMTIVEELGWTIVVHDEGLGQIEAYDSSRIFGFIDDVVIRISPDPEGSRVDIRSVSRVGLGDLGANADRIRRFMSAFT